MGEYRLFEQEGKHEYKEAKCKRVPNCLEDDEGREETDGRQEIFQIPDMTLVAAWNDDSEEASVPLHTVADPEPVSPQTKSVPVLV